MNSTMKKLAACGQISSLALLLVAASAAAAHAQSDRPWTTIGAAGTADEEDLVIFSGNIVYLDDDAAVIRYNVVAVDGLEGGQGLLWPQMTVRFRDNGNNNRVVVRLRRASIDGGTTEILLTLDSNDHAGSSSFQTRTVGTCGSGSNFSYDFEQYAYYIEVTLTRTSLPVTPGVASIQLDLGSCIGQ